MEYYASRKHTFLQITTKRIFLDPWGRTWIGVRIGRNGNVELAFLLGQCSVSVL